MSRVHSVWGEVLDPRRSQVPHMADHTTGMYQCDSCGRAVEWEEIEDGHDHGPIVDPGGRYIHCCDACCPLCASLKNESMRLGSETVGSSSREMEESDAAHVPAVVVATQCNSDAQPVPTRRQAEMYCCKYISKSKQQGARSDASHVPEAQCFTCPGTSRPDLMSPRSKREWEISGMCLKCQDKVFGTDLSTPVPESLFLPDI